MAQKYILEQLKDKMKLEPENLKLYYEANKEKYKTPQKALVRMMMFNKIEDAESAKEKLDKGEDFTAIARQVSWHSESAEKGGLIGEIQYGSFIPGFKEINKFSDVIFSLQVNKISSIEKIEGF